MIQQDISSSSHADVVGHGDRVALTQGLLGLQYERRVVLFGVFYFDFC